jgi:hypothetical protein
MVFTGTTFASSIGLAVVILAASAGEASANLVEAGITPDTDYMQTSNAQPSAPSFYNFSITGLSQSAGDFTSASINYPGPGSPIVVPFVGSSFAEHANFATLPALQASFPFGTYNITASNSSTGATQSTAINYPGNSFPNVVPYLTGGSYSALQNMNPSAAQLLTFNGFFSPDPTANASGSQFIITTINTNQVVFFLTNIPVGTTNITIPAGTLAANTSYLFDLQDYNFSPSLIMALA